MTGRGRPPLPLAGRYGAAVGLALLALAPNIVFTTAFPLLKGEIGPALGASALAMRLGEAFSNAAYSFGAVAAAGLAQRLPQRRLFLAYSSVFVAGSVLAVLAVGPVSFAFGRTLQGLGTGLLLVAALPPLVTQFPTARLPLTAIWINIGLFGAVTVGPLVGGLTAHFGAWRLLFLGLGILGVGCFAIGFLSLEPTPAADPEARLDGFALFLAAAATALPFFAVSWLTHTSFTAPGFILPLVIGLLALVVLITSQYRKKQAFIPVGPLFSTFPLCGILAAMVAGAAFVTLLELANAYLAVAPGGDRLLRGLLLTPELIGLVVAAEVFRRALPTRWLAMLALSGLVAIIVGAAVLVPILPGNARLLVPVAAVLLGYGAGAAVTPGLFMAGMSLPSTQLGRTFALVELLRAEAAFLIGPVLLSIAEAAAPPLLSGLRLSIIITLALAVAGTAAIGVLFWLGGDRPGQPDLAAWLEKGGRAVNSPPLLARLRRAGPRR